jgi:hypothetical protein
MDRHRPQHPSRHRQRQRLGARLRRQQEPLPWREALLLEPHGQTHQQVLEARGRPRFERLVHPQDRLVGLSLEQGPEGAAQVGLGVAHALGSQFPSCQAAEPPCPT